MGSVLKRWEYYAVTFFPTCLLYGFINMGYFLHQTSVALSSALCFPLALLPFSVVCPSIRCISCWEMHFRLSRCSVSLRMSRMRGRCRHARTCHLRHLPMLRRAVPQDDLHLSKRRFLSRSMPRCCPAAPCPLAPLSGYFFLLLQTDCSCRALLLSILPNDRVVLQLEVWGSVGVQLFFQRVLIT